ncbi:hypothetical protein HY497_02425 [Candidatus Woesearchaeota archaeon]|nr:hypothetical protein [Candidatus Woesearchaeota archaeon]
MKELAILNSRDVKGILKKLDEQFGIHCTLDYAFLMDQHKKIWLIHKDVNLVDFEQLRINSMGLYFAEINKYGEIRLTIEGSQLVGKLASKNVLILGKEQVKQYFKGEDVPVHLDVCGSPFLLLRFGDDFFGCAKLKEGVLLNYLPKVQRTQELIV